MALTESNKGFNRKIKTMPQFNNWDDAFQYWAKFKSKKYPFFFAWVKLKFEPPKNITSTS